MSKRKQKKGKDDLPVNIPLTFKVRAEENPDLTMQASKDADGKFQYFTYKHVYDDVVSFALALSSIGIRKGCHAALISDNRREWLVTDLALLSLGAADVPRGTDSMGSEIRYIISFSECEYGFFENSKQLAKILEKKDETPLLKTVILFDTIGQTELEGAKNAGLTVYQFSDLAEKGRSLFNESSKKQIEDMMLKVASDDIATIIFTSGTTGTPKGVMLTHRNYIAQLEVVYSVLPVIPGEMWLSVLPVWHSFERFMQYAAIALRSGIAYSKPIAAVMLPDFAVIKPQWMCGVPRLWESLAQGIYRTMRKAGGVKLALFNFFIAVGKKFAWAKEHVTGCVCRFTRRSRLLDFIIGIVPFILLAPLYGLGEVLIYKKVKAKLGGRFYAAISGGGALQSDTDAFYRAIGFRLLEGYGITEAGPVLSVRDCFKPRPGCVGVVYPSSQIKVVAEKDGQIVSNQALAPGKRGMILAKGDQIMKGYYKRPDLTAQAVDKDGWLNTGDLGMMTFDNEIKITGRAKDTIVLLGGENIEPAVIESALCASPYIESTVLLGQDKKFLSALIVPAKDAVTAWADENNVNYAQYEDLVETGELRTLLQAEIDQRVNTSPSFRTCERIFKFAVISKSFTVGDELSAKQEMIRHKIVQKYKTVIDSLFN